MGAARAEPTSRYTYAHMEVLGTGFIGVVVAAGSGFVDKFYSRLDDWEREKAHLGFIEGISQQGFDIGCRIPKVTDSENGLWNIGGKTYQYRNRMERLPGVTMETGCSPDNAAAVGKNLGAVLFKLHTESRKFMPQWSRDFDSSDGLFNHIINDKAKKVLAEELDGDIRRQVTKAVACLQSQESSLKTDFTLSHYDLNLNNILIDPHTSTINGLVDWAGFGLTHPSLSLYQLTAKRDIWESVRDRYLELGVPIAEDILYAAAVIHWVWAPLGLREVGWEFDENEMERNLKESIQLLKKHT